AVGSIQLLAKQKGHAGCARVLKVLVDAGRAPVTALEIKAVAALFFDKDYAGAVKDADLTEVVKSKTPDQWLGFAEANVRKGRPMGLWKAVSIAWYHALPKRKGPAPAAKLVPSEKIAVFKEPKGKVVPEQDAAEITTGNKVQRRCQGCQRVFWSTVG